MGTGLLVSRSIVERHRGRLWAEPNQGGRVQRLRFPFRMLRNILKPLLSNRRYEGFRSTIVDRGKHIPIVFIGAHAEPSLRQLVLQQGAAACLFKPFSDTVLEALNTARDN
jgi:CheY-like chemotaxis protein